MKVIRWRLHRILDNPYVRLVRFFSGKIFLVSFLCASLVGIWQFSLPNYYVCSVEFVPPYLDGLPSLKIVPGSSADLERFLTYLRSEAFFREMILELGLYKSYGMDSMDWNKYDEIVKRIKKRYSIKISKNSTLFVSYEGENPQISYRIIQYVLQKVHEKVISYSMALRQKQELTTQKNYYETLLSRVKNRLLDIRQSYKIVGFPDLTSGNAQIPYKTLLENPISFNYYDEAVALESYHRFYVSIIQSLEKNLIDIEGFIRLNEKYPWII
ncbi:MAG: hypothetical protein RMJ66_07640, partial [Bacteroidia bacterium]|nr:hypothetical protein [Bacteroidia bacterium]MDW8134921.1 hypothetical protein [Bacteroidia bacterium]